MYNSQCLQKHCSMFCHKYQVPSIECTIHNVYKSTAVRVCSAISIKCLLLNVQFTMSTKALQYRYVLPLVSSAFYWMYNSQCLQKYCSMFCHKYEVTPTKCTSHDVYKSTCSQFYHSIKCLLYCRYNAQCLPLASSFKYFICAMHYA